MEQPLTPRCAVTYDPALDRRPARIGLGTAVRVAATGAEGVVIAIAGTGAPPPGFTRSGWVPATRYVVQCRGGHRRLLRRSEVVVVSR
jgi:hypothetical protein